MIIPIRLLRLRIGSGIKFQDVYKRQDIYDMSPYDIAELFEKTVREEVGITVTFKAIDLEVSILED